MIGRNDLNGPIPQIFGEDPGDDQIFICKNFDRIVKKLGIHWLNRMSPSSKPLVDLRILSLREFDKYDVEVNPNT